ncbi:MAG: Maf family protein [Panacagrimonas sp.]
MSQLILASGSRFRASLLERLRLPFEQIPTGVDERVRPGEMASALATRLAQAKAASLAAQRPGAWILGSDQTAACGTRILGKPGTAEKAIEQLGFMQGHEVQFFTAVCLLNKASETTLSHLDRTSVKLRALGVGEIRRYVATEDVLDCAGSFRCEGLGISLFEQISSKDPTALIGLPLIETSRLLRSAGFTLP